MSLPPNGTYRFRNLATGTFLAVRNATDGSPLVGTPRNNGSFHQRVGDISGLSSAVLGS
jgi:hypothetical protein